MNFVDQCDDKSACYILAKMERCGKTLEIKKYKSNPVEPTRFSYFLHIVRTRGYTLCINLHKSEFFIEQCFSRWQTIFLI